MALEALKDIENVGGSHLTISMRYSFYSPHAR
jgi:hypothetical protein